MDRCSYSREPVTMSTPDTCPACGTQLAELLDAFDDDDTWCVADHWPEVTQ